MASAACSSDDSGSAGAAGTSARAAVLQKSLDGWTLTGFGTGSTAGGGLTSTGPIYAINEDVGGVAGRLVARLSFALGRRVRNDRLARPAEPDPGDLDAGDPAGVDADAARRPERNRLATRPR